MNEALKELIDRKAAENELDPVLLYVLLELETGWEEELRYAQRYEQNYPYLFNIFKRPDGCSRKTEEAGQRTSWGHWQIMGAVARERGFPPERWLAELTDPEVCIEYVLRHILYLWAQIGKRFILSAELLTPDEIMARKILTFYAAWNGGLGAIEVNALGDVNIRTARIRNYASQAVAIHKRYEEAEK